MTSRHALLPAITAAVVFTLAIVLPFAGCGLPLGGLPPDGADAGNPCDAVGQCDDANPCTADACTNGTCTYLEQPDGPAPTATQVAFDCKAVMCAQGVAKVQNDNADILIDAEDCTFDTCSDGKAFNTPKPDDTACTMGSAGGTCSGGKCKIVCTTADDIKCNDGNPCTQDSCDLGQGVCSFTPLNGVSTPGVAQKSGDCRVQICVDGKDTDSADDSDLPVTATDCDEELCTNGIATNPPLALDVSCGVNKDQYCDGAGTCGECNSPTHCPDPDNDCQERSCIAHVCGITFSPVLTPRAAPFQTSGDCKVVVCDGAGNSAAQPEVDDTDKPVDGNLCTKDICTGGTPTNPNQPANTACGVNGACNATGQCGCANDNACMAPETCGGGNPGTPSVCGCTTKTCSALGTTCGTVTDGCFAMQSCDTGTKNGKETDVDCGGDAGSCDTPCALGKQCNVNSDCGSGFCADGVCCNVACDLTASCMSCNQAGSLGTCSMVTTGDDSDSCVPMTRTCSATGDCLLKKGQPCVNDAECASNMCSSGMTKSCQ